MAPFLLSDKMGQANGTMNQFGQSLHDIVSNFESFFIQTMPDGTKHLTDMGESLRDVVLVTLEELGDIIEKTIKMLVKLNEDGNSITGMFTALMVPLKVIVALITALGSDGMQTIIMFKVMNSILPITELNIMGNYLAMLFLNDAEQKNATIKGSMIAAQSMMNIGMMAGLFLLNQQSTALKVLGGVILFVAGAYAAAAIAKEAFGKGIAGAGMAGGLLTLAMGLALHRIMKPPDIDTFDTGGRVMYDTGGLGNRHVPIMVEPGETVVSKTQNMLGGGGITLNIAGDIVTSDADDFAERIAEALPEALRRQNDIGGI